jgi:hypothetical protein
MLPLGTLRQFRDDVNQVSVQHTENVAESQLYLQTYSECKCLDLCEFPMSA